MANSTKKRVLVVCQKYDIEDAIIDELLAHGNTVIVPCEKGNEERFKSLANRGCVVIEHSLCTAEVHKPEFRKEITSIYRHIIKLATPDVFVAMPQSDTQDTWVEYYKDAEEIGVIGNCCEEAQVKLVFISDAAVYTNKSRICSYMYGNEYSRVYHEGDDTSVMFNGNSEVCKYTEALKQAEGLLQGKDMYYENDYSHNLVYNTKDKHTVEHIDGCDEDLRYVILRPSFIIPRTMSDDISCANYNMSPGHMNWLYRLVYLSDYSGVPFINDGQVSLDTITLGSLASAVRLVVENNSLRHRTLNVSNGERMLFKEFTELLFSELGWEPRVNKLTLIDYMKIIENEQYRMYTGSHSGTATYKSLPITSGNVINDTRIRDLLGYKPTESVKEALRKYAENYREAIKEN